MTTQLQFKERWTTAINRSVKQKERHSSHLIPCSLFYSTLSYLTIEHRFSLKGGGIVWLPAGTYFLGGTLVVYGNCVLKGVASIPMRSWGTSQQIAATTLLATSGHGNAAGTPLITLRGHGAGVEGT
jgi:hypothetical protein